MLNLTKEQKTMSKHHLRRSVAAAALVAAVALIVAACDGSGETSASSPAGSVSGSSASTISVAGESGSVVFTGLIDYPMTFTALDMDYMDWAAVTADDPELGAPANYEGVRLSDVLSYVGVQPEAQTLVITALDGSTAEMSLAEIPADALLTVADDSSLSTVMPGMAAEMWVKDVVAMEFK
jgi:hypothetical protein